MGATLFLVALAISRGFRESGITSVTGKRVIVAIFVLISFLFWF